jgi:hypothetical protein
MSAAVETGAGGHSEGAKASWGMFSLSAGAAVWVLLKERQQAFCG